MAHRPFLTADGRRISLKGNVLNMCDVCFGTEHVVTLDERITARGYQDGNLWMIGEVPPIPTPNPKRK